MVPHEFQGSPQLEPHMPRDGNLSEIYTSDRCLFYRLASQQAHYFRVLDDILFWTIFLPNIDSFAY